MTTRVKRLVQGTLVTTSDVTLYTSAANTQTVIKAMNVVNTSGGAVTFTLNLVANGGSASSANTVISAYSIAAGASYQCPEAINQVLETGDFISVKAGSGSALQFTASGVTVS